MEVGGGDPRARGQLDLAENPRSTRLEGRPVLVRSVAGQRGHDVRLAEVHPSAKRGALPGSAWKRIHGQGGSSGVEPNGENHASAVCDQDGYGSRPVNFTLAATVDRQTQ